MDIGKFVFEAKKIPNLSRPGAIAKEIMYWTEFQSWLTDKICLLVLKSRRKVPPGQEKIFVEQLVYSYLIRDWQNQLAASHFKQIEQSLGEGKQRQAVLLRLQEILQQKVLSSINSPEDLLLRSSGLIVKKIGKLKFANPIYKAVFTQRWLLKQLAEIEENSSSVNTSESYAKASFILNSKLNSTRKSANAKSIKKIAIASMVVISLGIVVKTLPQISGLIVAYRCNHKPLKPLNLGDLSSSEISKYCRNRY
ncbi:hypothetical protein I4641_02610 [Waterburya agarophytonicola K14]|uniref:Uncharacterized protein n=1 Tax=Waterburya agarophytonicola KI4 TaxID=2874699 RepID=A0A964FFN8_9CYAN|nr:hypothetical protein [Waterburya agarophytonicola]MCC0175874.1 hypothetical protein [Waterburya agarophytonicola KI4]